LRTNSSGVETCVALSLHQIYVKAILPDDKPIQVKVAIESIQGFHRRGKGTMNIIKHSQEVTPAGFFKCIQSENGFVRFFSCSLKEGLKPAARGGFLSSFSCCCVIGKSTELHLDFKKTDLTFTLDPLSVNGLSSIMDNVSDITDVISGPTEPQKVDLQSLLVADYADRCRDAADDFKRNNKTVFVIDQTADVDKAGREYSSFSELPGEIKSVVSSMERPVVVPDEEDGTYDDIDDDEGWKDAADDKADKLIMSIEVENLTLSASVHFVQHDIYKPEEHVKLGLRLERLHYTVVAPSIPDEGAPNPFTLNVRVGDISISNDFKDSSWKHVFSRDEKRMKKWAEKEDTVVDTTQEEINGMMESRIDGLTPSFFKTSGSILRVLIQSRNCGQQSLALTVKARMQPIRLNVSQRLLAFVFEFKKIAFPSKPADMQREQKPVVNVWSESVFDEVHIMPIKVVFTYHPQLGAPVPVFEASNGFKWVFVVVPSLDETETSFSEFQFVSRNRPVPLSVLKDELISSYSPSLRNVLDIAGSLGPVHLMVKFFKKTAQIMHVHKSDLTGENPQSLNMLTRGLNTVAVETVNLGSQSFFAIVRLLHWVDSAVAGEETQEITEKKSTPDTLAEGFKGAGMSIVQGFTSAIDGVTRMPISAFHNGGFLSSIATFTRNVPGVVIRPVVGVGDALIKILFSVRNTLDPDYKNKEMTPYTVPDATQSNPTSSESAVDTTSPHSSLLKGSANNPLDKK